MTIVQELKRRGFQEGIEKGIQEGIQEGIRKGMLEEKRSTARAMKNEGIDMKTISRVTGLSEAEIRNI